MSLDESNGRSSKFELEDILLVTGECAYWLAKRQGQLPFTGTLVSV